MSCAVIRTRPPERCTEPSRMPSTPSACAISGSGFLTFLNCMTEVREITFRARDLGEIRNQCFGHAVGEVFLFRIARKVRQRQNRQGTDGSMSRSAEQLVSYAAGVEPQN